MKKGAAESEQATRKVGRGSRKATKDVRRLDKSMGGLGKTAGLVKGLLFSAFAGIGAALAAGTAVTVITNFEQSLDTLGAVSGATEDQLSSLEDTARSLGATTKFSASEAADGLLFLARAGFTVEEQIAALPATLDLAAAAGIGLGEAADFASNILSQFGLQAEDTARLTDTLVTVANKANTDVTQLANAMKFAGPAAAAAGKDVEEAAAAIGVLSDAGIQGSMAGRGLRQILVKLAKPTAEAKKEFKDLGIAISDMDPTANSLAEIFARLESENLDLAGAAAIFGSEQASAALVMAEATEKMLALEEASRKAAGTTREVAKAMSDNLGGALKSLRSSVEEMFLQLGDAGLRGALTRLVRGITDVVRVLIGMEDSVDGNLEKAQKYARVVKALAGGLGFLLLAKSIQGTVVAVKALTIAIAANPLGLLLTAVSATVAALIFFKDEMVEIKGVTASVGDFVVATWQIIQERGEEAIKLTVIAFQEGWRLIGETAEKAITFINDLFPNFESNLSSLWENPLKTAAVFANTVVGFLVGIGDAILVVVTSLDDVAAAFAQFDPTDVFGGFGLDKVKDQLGFVGSEIGFEVGKNFKKALDETDVTGALTDLFTSGVSDFKSINEGGLNFTDFFTGSAGGGAGAGSAIADRVKEIQLLRKQTEAAKIGAEVAQRAFMGLFLQPGQGEEDSLESRLAALDKMLEETGEKGVEAARKTEDAFVSMGEAIEAVTVAAAAGLGGELGNIIFESKNAGEALEDFVKTAIRQLFDLIVTQNLVAAAGSLFAPVPAADGRVFDRGGVTAFAKGGVINSPTLFPMAGGGSGLMGEAGPEAVMPLRRGPDGKLGVQASTGSRGTPVSVTLNVNGVRDVDGFRSNERQIIGRINSLIKLSDQ